MTKNDDTFEDIGIRIGAQDVEWMLSSVDLMLATSMASGCSDETRERMKGFREQLALQSALPRHSSSYGDSFRYRDAIAAVRDSDAWEARLILDRKSYFKDCRLAIETHKDGRRSHYRLTSDLRLGRDSEVTPMDKYGVYLNRLVDICQNVAPASSVQMEEGQIRLLADWRRYLELDNADAKNAVGAVFRQALVAEQAKAPFAIRNVDLARWNDSDEKALPEHLRYLEVTVSATSEGHAHLAGFVADYNDDLAAGSEWNTYSAHTA